MDVSKREYPTKGLPFAPFSLQVGLENSTKSPPWRPRSYRRILPTRNGLGMGFRQYRILRPSNEIGTYRSLLPFPMTGMPYWISEVMYLTIGAVGPKRVTEVLPQPVVPQVSAPVTIMRCAFPLAEEPPEFK